MGLKVVGSFSLSSKIDACKREGEEREGEGDEEREGEGEKGKENGKRKINVQCGRNKHVISNNLLHKKRAVTLTLSLFVSYLHNERIHLHAPREVEKPFRISVRRVEEEGGRRTYPSGNLQGRGGATGVGGHLPVLGLHVERHLKYRK